MLLTPKTDIQRKPNVITIISAARRTKVAEADIYIDVSLFMVDDWDFRYNGTEPIIQNTLYSNHAEFFVHLSSLLFTMNVESGMVVVLVCEAGERRSVASAEMLAREIQGSYKVEVYHKELSKWLKF
jgi:RNase adaptor protein for sRNA GlmZ degradation